MRALALTFPHGRELEDHHHDWPQLVYGARGVISVRSEWGHWVVPPMRALWVGAGVPHALQMVGRVAMRTVYLRPDLAPTLPARCCVVEVSPLLRELVLSVVSTHGLRNDDAFDQARLSLFLELLHALPTQPLELPMPTDARARAVASRVWDEVGCTDSLPALAAHCGASARTVERLFTRETGMTFGRWRQQARMLRALQLLGSGMAVTAVALEVGYASPSAFVVAFRRSLGRTPGEYFASRRSPRERPPAT